MSDPDFPLIAKTLADPTRFSLLASVARCGETRCADLFENACISAPTMSHHMRELERAGLIATERDGRFLRVIFRAEAMRAYVAHLSDALRLNDD